MEKLQRFLFNKTVSHTAPYSTENGSPRSDQLYSSRTLSVLKQTPSTEIQVPKASLLYVFYRDGEFPIANQVYLQ